MRHVAIVVLSLVLASSAAAQVAASYIPPDAELWRNMREAAGNLSMPLSAHQQLQQIFNNVEQQARVNAARVEAERRVKETPPAKTE